MTTTTMTRPAPRSTGRLWAYAPAAILVPLIGAQLVLLHGALSDPSVAVERDYYQKAMTWDAKMAQDRENARLAFRTTASVHPGAARGDRVLRLEVLDSSGLPVTGATVTVEAFAVARSGNVVQGTLGPTRAGVYEATLPMARPGQWELRFTVQRGTERFTATQRRDLPFPEVSR